MFALEPTAGYWAPVVEALHALGERLEVAPSADAVDYLLE